MSQHEENPVWNLSDILLVQSGPSLLRVVSAHLAPAPRQRAYVCYRTDLLTSAQRKLSILHPSLIVLKKQLLPHFNVYNVYHMFSSSFLFFFFCFLSSQVSEDIGPAEGDRHQNCPVGHEGYPKMRHLTQAPCQVDNACPYLPSPLGFQMLAAKCHFQRTNDLNSGGSVWQPVLTPTTPSG